MKGEASSSIKSGSNEQQCQANCRSPRMQSVDSKMRKKSREDYDAERSIYLTRWISKPIGAWPALFGTSWLEKCYYRTMNVLCYIFILFIFVPCGLYTLYDVPVLYRKIKLTGPLSFCIMCAAKYSSLICAGKDIHQCIEQIIEDWSIIKHEKDRAIMTQNAAFGRQLIIICSSFLYGSMLFFYLCLPLSMGKVSAGENFTYIQIPLPVASILLDVRKSPANEIFFLGQVVCGLTMHTISASTYSLIAVFVMHACGQLEVLMVWLEHLVDGREDLSKDADDRMAMIVERHVRTISFVNRTEKIFRNISLVEVMGCTLNMCLDGYYLIMDSTPEQPLLILMNGCFLFSFTFNIFILCYIGELVAEQCKKVGDASYLTEWYQLPGNSALGLILIITSCNSGTKLTAGNFMDLTIATFGDVVKTSVAYLNMLRTLTS